MACVYILYSKEIDKYYVGSCVDLIDRFSQHLNKQFVDSFTSRANDWQVYFSCEDLQYEVARKIELHIKSMKSRKYFADLKVYPEILLKLIAKYS